MFPAFQKAEAYHSLHIWQIMRISI